MKYYAPDQEERRSKKEKSHHRMPSTSVAWSGMLAWPNRPSTSSRATRTDIARFDGNTSVLTRLCRDEGAYSRTVMRGLNDWFDMIHVSKHLSINDVRGAMANGPLTRSHLTEDDVGKPKNTST
jgi:hypothetical protein